MSLLKMLCGTALRNLLELEATRPHSGQLNLDLNDMPPEDFIEFVGSAFDEVYDLSENWVK